MSQLINGNAMAGKATRLIEQRWVARPQEEAFIYTADFSNLQHWDPGVVSARKITNGPVGVGTCYEVEVRFGSGTSPMIYEITVYEPYSRVVLVGSGEKLYATDEIRFASHDNMTVIDYTADLSFRNFYRFLGPLLRARLNKVGKDALDGLVTALDG
ncbi:MAG TPA: SRPBCC family protein [Acidimicrobiia bacterium]|nr:SRPBCC family protein [Acidimicrobiia bacterium]